jgi:hypothetical protein
VPNTNNSADCSWSRWHDASRAMQTMANTEKKVVLINLLMIAFIRIVVLDVI